MEDDIDGAAQAQEPGEPQDGAQDAGGAQGEDGAAQDGRQVAGDPAGKPARRLPDYEAQLAAKDAQIQELQAKVAEAAKTSEATEDLNRQIAALKQAMSDERVEFALISAGARNVKAARALLDDHDGDVAALKDAEPWLFDPNSGLLPGDSQLNSQIHEITTRGAMGLEPAGVAGGRPGQRQMRHWEEIAGLVPASDEGKGE